MAADNKTGKGSSMNYWSAQDLLDARREGADMPQHVILKALTLTGDIEADSLQELIESESHE